MSRKSLNMVLALSVSLGVAQFTPLAEPMQVEASGFNYTAEQQEALKHFNAIRAKHGLSQVELDPFLNKAAENHLNYIKLNGYALDLSVHNQERGKAGFTGVRLADRLTAVGTPNQSASIYHEVISGQKTIVGNLDELMYAPYHRIKLMDTEARKVGVAFNGESFVMVTENARGVSYQKPLMYPYNGQTNVGIGFYGNEIPNPLAQFKVDKSGFVISYQPEPHMFVDERSIKFVLKDNKGVVVPFHQELHPAGKSFFFPKQELKYNEKYTASIEYKDYDTGEKGTHTWSFTTQVNKDTLTYWTPANPNPGTPSNPSNPTNPTNPTNPSNPTQPNPPAPVAPVNPTNYADYRTGVWWTADMLWGVQSGLISGYSNVWNPATKKVENQLRPNENVTEAQFITILYRYIDHERLNGTKASDPFWASNAYQLAQQDRLPVKGSAMNRQVANSAITRGDVAHIMATRHLQRPLTKREAVDFIYSMGIANGYADASGNVPKTYESFRPDTMLTRAQVVTMMRNYDNYFKMISQ